MNKYIVPIPFQMAPLGVSSAEVYKSILSVHQNSTSDAKLYRDDQIQQNTIITDPVAYDFLPDDQPLIGRYLRSAMSMQENSAQVIENLWGDCQQLCVLGGDHSTSIGTGAGLARVTDLSRVGVVWLSAHGNINTEDTSNSKAISGYPLAVLTGLGPEKLTNSFGSNFVKKVVHIGLRDCEKSEAQNFNRIESQVHSPFDIEFKGLSKVLKESAKFLKDCDIIWLSCDVSVLDEAYFEQGESDVTVPGGLTPREVLAIAQFFSKTNKLKVSELVQINQSYYQTPIIKWAHRFIEVTLGLAPYRYGK